MATTVGYYTVASRAENPERVRAEDFVPRWGAPPRKHSGEAVFDFVKAMAEAHARKD